MKQTWVQQATAENQSGPAQNQALETAMHELHKDATKKKEKTYILNSCGLGHTRALILNPSIDLQVHTKLLTLITFWWWVQFCMWRIVCTLYLLDRKKTFKDMM